MDEAFAKNKTNRHHEVSENFPYPARIISNKGSQNTPKWVPYLETAEQSQDELTHSISELTSVSPRAAIAIEVKGRIFVVPFGTANMHLVNASKIETNFGLKVALNCIAEGAYRSFESKQVASVVMDVKRQASRSTSKGTFSLEEDREQLRYAVGVAQYGIVDSIQVVGRDAFRASLPGTVLELGSNCEELLRLYESKTYKSHGFGFIDNLVEVREPDLKVTLNDALENKIRNSETEAFSLSPPRAIEWESIGGFKHKGQQDSTPNLDLEDYLETLPSNLDFSIKSAQNDKVRVVDLNGQPLERWRVYDCLTGSVSLDSEPSHIYVLSEGKWYRIAQTYADELLEEVRKLPTDLVELPDWDGGSEELYSIGAAKENNFVLYDGHCIKPSNSSPHSKVEPCDLYCHSGKLIHVKPYTRSSTLSHLFAQGYVSAELILNDETYRTGFHKKLPAGGGNLITPKRRPNAEELTVVYAILCKTDSGSWPDCLPFFSLVNLRASIRRLKALGFQVGIQRVLKSKAAGGQNSPPLSQLKTSTLKSQAGNQQSNSLGNVS